MSGPRARNVLQALFYFDTSVNTVTTKVPPPGMGNDWPWESGFEQDVWISTEAPPSISTVVFEPSVPPGGAAMVNEAPLVIPGKLVATTFLLLTSMFTVVEPVYVNVSEPTLRPLPHSGGGAHGSEPGIVGEVALFLTLTFLTFLTLTFLTLTFLTFLTLS